MRKRMKGTGSFMKKFNNRGSKRYIIETLAVIVLFLLACVMPVKEYTINLSDMTWKKAGNSNLEHDQAKVTVDNGSGTEGEVSEGPFLKLPLGYYELIVDYSTDEKNNFVEIKSKEKNRAIYHAETKFDKFNNHLKMPFQTKEAVQDLEVVFHYCGKGSFTMNAIKIVASKIHRFYAIALALIVLLITEIFLYYQHKDKKIKPEHFILAVGFLLALIPLIGKGVFVGDDWCYHVARLDSLADNFANGDFITKIHGKTADSYGYGTGFFYSDLFMIVPAFLCWLGLPLEMGYKFFIFTIIVMMMTVSYYTSAKFFKDKQIASIIAVLMTNSHYILMNLYGRTAVGEALGYVFLVLITAGLYNLVREKFSQPYILIMGFCGVVLSHTISTVFAITMAVCVVLFNVKSIYREKLIGKLSLSAIMTLLLTAWYWVPMVEQMMSQKFNYSKPWIWVYNNSQDVITTLGAGKIELGAFLTVILIVGIVISYNFAEIRKWIITAIILIVIVSQDIIWAYTGNVTKVVQFPWRLLGVTALTLFIALGLCIQKLPKRIPMIVIAAILIGFNYYCNISFFDNATQRKDIVVGTIYALEGELGGGKEWMPLAENTVYQRVHPEEAVGNDGVCIQGEKKGLTFKFHYHAADSVTESFEIPYLYYKGYVASYANEREKGEIAVTKSSNGLVQIQVPQNIGNSDVAITIQYKYTRITKVSIIVSVLSLIIYVAMFATGKKKEKTLR